MSRRSTIFPLLILLILPALVLPASLYADGSRGVSTYLEGADPDLEVGRQYLVVIGINEYQHWLPLHSPVQDVQEIRDILTSRYHIDEVHELYDEQATKANIIRLFVLLQEKVQIHDSVLVLYSGHGHLDENSDIGFWIPVNGGTDIYEQLNWLPHTQLRGLIANIEASHVCVISDSCFAGDLIYNTRSIPPTLDAEYFRRSYSRVSRQVLTSGATEAVPDRSEFAEQLKSILRRNQKPLIDSLMLYNEVRLGVESSIPLLGALGGTGHQEGASFVLFLREEAQEEPTPFGPIHLQPGPSLAAVGEQPKGYLTTGLLAGAVFPVAEMSSRMSHGLNLRAQLHVNRGSEWGIFGLGISMGFVTLSTDPDEDEVYSMESIPVAVNLRYIAVPRSRFFWSAELGIGGIVNFIAVKEIEEDRLTTCKPFLAPALSLGRRFFDRWMLSARSSFMLILFDNNCFTGITVGAGVEYAL